MCARMCMYSIAHVPEVIISLIWLHHKWTECHQLPNQPAHEHFEQLTAAITIGINSI